MSDSDDAADELEGMVSTTPGGRRGIDKNDMVAEYLPDDDAYVEKTVLDLEDPARVAVLRILGDLYPELNELQEPIDGFLDTFLRAKISINGASRAEAENILRAMYGASDDDKAGGEVLARALGVDQED